MKRFLAIFLFLGCIVAATAQSREWTLMHQGNKAFRAGDYKTAEDNYRRALAANPHSTRAAFNLGDAYLAQKNGKDALQQFVAAAKGEQNKLVKAMAYHNIGTICQRHQLYGDAIKAYQEALRNNPNDNETRYNLALCKRLNKNNKDQQKQQQKQEQKQEQQKEQKEKEKQQPKPKEQMSKENAEQLLNATIQDEKATQQRLKKAMQQPSRRTVEKNW